MSTATSTRELILDDLNPREREVLQLTVEGHSNREIAERLMLQPQTVRRLFLDAARKLLTSSAPAVVAGRQLEAVVDAMLPESVPSSAEAWHAQQNAQARVDLLQEFGALTADQVADLAGSKAANRSALASRWHNEGRILGVSWHGRTLYPGFQFRDGRPNPTVAYALKRLREHGLDGWALALWFATPTGWLWDRRPIDVIDEDPQTVLTAADEALSLPA